MKIKSSFRTKREAIAYLEKRGWIVFRQKEDVTYLKHEMIKPFNLLWKAMSGQWVVVR